MTRRNISRSDHINPLQPIVLGRLISRRFWVKLVAGPTVGVAILLLQRFPSHRQATSPCTPRDPAAFRFHCGRARNPTAITMARVYADVNEHMPRSYWDYDSVNISWGVLENYEIVRKIGK